MLEVCRILRRVLAFVAPILIAASPGSALAWGPEGHAIVADIASLHLRSAAQQQVTRLLAREHHQRLDQISSWADDIRSDRRETGPWHYVDIPLSARRYKASRDCPHGNCVVARIGYFARILADKRAAPARRLDALKFVVHFVADVQQPLHAEDNNDYGGNDVAVTFFGRDSNLHQLWDSRILEHALGLHLGRGYRLDRTAVWKAARTLNAGISAAETREWAPAGREINSLPAAAVAWANQAHGLARNVAYADLPSRHQYDHQSGWSQSYEEQTWPVVKQQLQRGGIRLAAVLNAILK